MQIYDFSAISYAFFQKSPSRLLPVCLPFASSHPPVYLKSSSSLPTAYLRLNKGVTSL